MVKRLERIAHLKRFQKIINTLVKHGFGQLVHDLGIEDITRHLPFHLQRKGRKDVKELSKAVRFRMVLEELGPTFIKFGQLLSTRADVIPPDYINELRRLQDQVSPFSFSQVKEVVEKELKYPLDVLFENFNEVPLAAASIAQVHRAILPGGQEVAVKVQRPDIKKIIAVDLAILEEIALLLDKYTAIGKVYNFSGIVEEFSHILNMELNFYLEGRNAGRFKKNFSGEKNVYIPHIYWSYTTKKILTMEYVDGIKLNNKEGLINEGFSSRKIVENLSKVFLKQILWHGFFHGDPHPGNIGVLRGEQLYFLDFGIAGNLSEEQQQNLGRLLMGFLSRNLEQVLDAIMNLGIISDVTDRKYLRMELERLQEKYFDIPLKDIHFGQAMHELMEICFKQHIRLPTEFTLLAKTFLTLEGLISELDPGFSIAELVKPFGKEFIRNQFSRKKIAFNIYKHLNKYLHLLEIFPERFISILEKGAGGNVKFKVEVVETEHLLNRLNNMVNRISFSIVLASIIVGLCLMLQFTEVTLFRRFPLAEIGLILAAFMGFWWLWSIIRSGRL
ncbi:MAG: hypothetical protein C4554_04035 [Dethiobacter sp.]|jgi:ubiquinone biosynthesis protein|nr:MAG: hypothetical protein C4554_04035 [Dethiobacter sp.]